MGDEDKLSVPNEWAYILLDPDFAGSLWTDDIIYDAQHQSSAPPVLRSHFPAVLLFYSAFSHDPLSLCSCLFTFPLLIAFSPTLICLFIFVSFHHVLRLFSI